MLKHLDKDTCIMLSQLLQSMYVCISDDQKTVVMIRMATRKPTSTTDFNSKFEMFIISLF